MEKDDPDHYHVFETVHGVNRCNNCGIEYSTWMKSFDWVYKGYRTDIEIAVDRAWEKSNA